MKASSTVMSKIYLAVATSMLAMVAAGCSDPAEEEKQLCSAASCPSGCCSNGQCESGTSASSCGASGGSCAVCGKDESCVAGACKKVGGCTSGWRGQQQHLPVWHRQRVLRHWRRGLRRLQRWTDLHRRRLHCRPC